MNKIVFVHYYGTRESPAIFTQIVDALIDSGLYEAATEVHLVLSGDLAQGPTAHDINRLTAKILVGCLDPDSSSVGEIGTLMKVRDYALASPVVQAVCYLHTKGATNNSAIQVGWRTFMLDFIAYCWRHAEDKLRSFHLWGVNWSYSTFSFDDQYPVDEWQRPFGHFMGNYWWARSDYLATLPAIDQTKTSRYLAEAWVGMRSGRVFNAMRSPVALPDAIFPRERYLKLRDQLLHPTICMEIRADTVREYGASSLTESQPSADVYRHDPNWEHLVN